MGIFKKRSNNRNEGGNRQNFAEKNWDNSNNRSRPGMHQATCAQCGSPCEVPFRPIEGRPIYCNTCFRDIRERNTRKTGNDRIPQRSFNDRKPFNKPDFTGNSADRGNADLKRQLDMLNSKIDRLIEAVHAMTNANLPVPAVKPAASVSQKPAAKAPAAKAPAAKTKKTAKKTSKAKKK